MLSGSIPFVEILHLQSHFTAWIQRLSLRFRVHCRKRVKLQTEQKLWSDFSPGSLGLLVLHLSTGIVEQNLNWKKKELEKGREGIRGSQFHINPRAKLIMRAPDSF